MEDFLRLSRIFGSWLNREGGNILYIISHTRPPTERHVTNCSRYVTLSVPIIGPLKLSELDLGARSKRSIKIPFFFIANPECAAHCQNFNPLSLFTF